MSILFIGNCQVVTLWQMFRDILPGSETVNYMPSYEAMSEAEQAALDSADRLVWQVTEFEQEVAHPSDSRPCYFVPVVNCPFLFPLSGEPHPLNQAYEFWPDGPYPAETGDSLLNKMILDRVELDVALERYFEIEVAKVRHVQRTMEICLDRQSQRDKRCGNYRCAEIIEEQFRHESLFLTRGHLGRRLNHHLVDILLEEMGFGLGERSAAEELDPQKYVPPTEQPIHPSVAEFFNLKYVSEETPYKFNYEGAFTSREWARRYMSYEWSRELMVGLWHFHAGRMRESIAHLTKAVEECPRSSIARESLAFAEAR